MQTYGRILPDFLISLKVIISYGCYWINVDNIIAYFSSRTLTKIFPVILPKLSVNLNIAI